ncbi:MAG: 16S rRNA (cytidine(1402)-2'-O)-methyltransferase [Holosporales bacterium]|jgi:16S rRNA (cytidine1402-2'-O)-methyltransferase|nr:16S rRNA (cytidine(1402)-2'-O)-methyltransferase [Holosporales bacterium]
MQTYVNIISTPIGNLKDITLRAIETLQSVDVILCEDTRVSHKLLAHYGIQKQLMIYNDQTAKSAIPKIVRSIKTDGKRYGLISDAGTPLISDPGYRLVTACIENEIGYTVIPGASSVLSALILSGLPSDRFLFAGFADIKKFHQLTNVDASIVFFESPRRLLATLHQMEKQFPTREVAVVREITKIHEEVVRGSFSTVIEHFESHPPRGEFVILLSPPKQQSPQSELAELAPLIRELAGKISRKDLSEILSSYTKIGRSKVYRYLGETSPLT